LKLSALLSLSLSAAASSSLAALLIRRHRWEQSHNQVVICVDFDDAMAAAIRAGLGHGDLLGRLAEHVATHLSLPELTLNRLVWLGRLAPQAPAEPLTGPPLVGHWNYLHGEPGLVTYLADELRQRLPYTEARVIAGGTLAFAGDRPTIGEIGLGFEPAAAASISQAGLAIVPRPVSYAWPDKALLERTLAQAAGHGPLIAFAGDMTLGHEMHLDETLAAMERHSLWLVFFVESRHQKGDWFIAKRRAPRVLLAHAFSAQEMGPLDFHAAAHNWAYLARERGIRFCYVNFFRVLHATEPLEGLRYLSHLKAALEQSGFEVNRRPKAAEAAPTATVHELALAGIVSATIGAAAVERLLPLPDRLAVPLTLVGAVGAAGLPFVERARNIQRAGRAGGHDHHHDNGHDHHHDDSHDHHYDDSHDHHHDDGHDHHYDNDHDHGDLQALYPPSYAPKLLALVAAALAPVAASPLDRGPERRSPSQVWLELGAYPALAAVALAALTTGREYALRIEEYRGLNLDWLAPAMAMALRRPMNSQRLAAGAALLAAWRLAQKRGLDPLAAVDPGHAMGHTHHISVAQRLAGDALLAIGPRPARKWAWLGPAAGALSLALNNRRSEWAWLAGAASSLGHMLTLVSYRRPERALAITGQEALPSYGTGLLVGLAVLLLPTNERP
jgi:hypothetical protein